MSSMLGSQPCVVYTVSVGTSPSCRPALLRAQRTDHRGHGDQNVAIAAYIRWHDHQAQPKTRFAASSHIRSWTGYPTKVA
jgi:hypothetical protein